MRKQLLYIACGLLAISGFNEVKALQGGPDAYGYVWRDSNEPSGPTFSWVDIENRPGTVQVTGLADDNSVGQFNIGWDFHYYWSDYNKVKLGSNGWISFNNVGNIASCFPTLPTAGGAGDNLVVPYMSDLTYISSVPANPNPGRMFYWSNSVDSFIVQYKTVPWWRQGTPDWIGSNTFQVILSGQDSSITFQYLDTDAANLAVAAQCPSSMEIGIENITGNVGLQVSTGTVVPVDNYAIKFYYPANVTFQVPDATPAWAANSDNAGQFVFTGSPISFDANIANSGNAAITNQINVNGVLKNSASANVWTNSTSIPGGLVAGANATVTFPLSTTLNNAGQYTLEVTSVNSQDINPSNNLTKVEIAAVNNSGGYAQLSYCSGNLPDGSISWAGGGIDDGVAIKVVPPAYPMTIDSISVFILGDDGDPLSPLLTGFDLLVLGEDANGNPDLNNVLQVENISAAQGLEDNWNRIALDSSVTVASGAVFIAWLQGGTGIALGTEALSPISRRSYEVLGGAVSPYRDNTVNEFLIQVASVLPVGIAEPAVPGKLAAYPNPSRGLVNVAFEVVNVTDSRFSIYNTVGQQVWTKLHSDIAPGGYEFQIDLSGFAPGVYFLNQETIDGRKVVKLIVE
jgi:hypothetical protein